MEFEQISIFDSPGVFPRQLDSDGKIYCKLDWLTVIFFDSTLNHVLHWLQHDDCISEFCEGAYEQSRGYDQVFRFVYNNILIETSAFNFYGRQEDLSMFDVVLPKIRLDLSGSALDYLRSCGIDMDTYRFTVPKLPEGGSYHFTRCDFAFDFINYRPDFVDRLIDHIRVHALPSGRVPLASSKGAIGCKVVTCNQKTVYLGSPQSDRMLRVYDKRMEQMNLATGLYKKPNPYGNPDSWFRIEWQTRNKFANDLVQDRSLQMLHILKMIFQAYAFADGTVDNHNAQRPPVEFWLSLFDWKDIEKRTIQKANFIQYVTSAERLKNRVESIIMREMILYFSLYGTSEFINAARDWLRNIQQKDPVNVRRWTALLNKMNECKLVVPTEPCTGMFWDCGFVNFDLKL